MSDGDSAATFGVNLTHNLGTFFALPKSAISVVGRIKGNLIKNHVWVLCSVVEPDNEDDDDQQKQQQQHQVVW